MADDDDNSPGQQELPGTNETGKDDAISRAESRAREAEKRAKAAEKREKDRADAEAKAKRDADIKSADDARAALADAEKREKAALARLESFEKREAQRIDGLVAKLPKAEQERLGKYRERLGDDFGSFIEEELTRMSGGGGGDGDDPDTAHASGEQNPPPPANPGGIMRRTKGTGRGIEPWAQARLDEMGIDSGAARNSLEVEREGRSAKFIFPPAKMRTLMRERALKPDQLTQEQYDALHRSK